MAGSLQTADTSARVAAMMLRCDSMTDSGMPACCQQGWGREGAEVSPLLAAGVAAGGGGGGADEDEDDPLCASNGHAPASANSSSAHNSCFGLVIFGLDMLGLLMEVPPVELTLILGQKLPRRTGNCQREISLPHGILLTRRFDTCENPDSQKYDRAHDNPVRGHMHQVGGVSQSADQDCEPNRVNSERHGISLSSQGWRIWPENSACSLRENEAHIIIGCQRHAKQAREKPSGSQANASGAKARSKFERLNGTSKLVPFPKPRPSFGFSASCKAVPFPQLARTSVFLRP
jgi:hypothetical protein